MNKKNIIPADVPKEKHTIFTQHYETITKKTDNLFLFAVDQKIEHLNDDFYGNNIPEEVNDPKRIFQIAQEGDMGALASHVGLIARYAKNYTNINYIAKLNSKTNLIKKELKDPLSSQLWTIEDVLTLKKEVPSICGIGYTIYIGSEYEAEMLSEAAQLVQQAHKHGLVSILWIYLRGKSIQNERDGHSIAGAAGIASALGSDFVKIKPPASDNKNSSIEWLKIANQAAGNTKVICSGGPLENKEAFLQTLYNQIHTANTHGCATGRNIFQRPFTQAVAISKAIAAIVYKNATIENVKKIYDN